MPDTTPSQKFRGDDARKTNALVEQLRALLEGQPVAIAVTAINIVKHDITAQLQFKRTEFEF